MYKILLLEGLEVALVTCAASGESQWQNPVYILVRSVRISKKAIGPAFRDIAIDFP